MSEYERTGTVRAEPSTVFAYVSNIQHLPNYLPTTQSAATEGSDHVRIQGEVRGHRYDADGFFHVDSGARRMEWASDGENAYRGWLQVGPDGAGSTVTIHLSFVPRLEYGQQLDAATGNRDRTVEQVLESTLASIQNHCEGCDEKVEPPAVR